MAPIAPAARAVRTAHVRTCLLLLSCLGLASAARAQAPITTAVGQIEVTAVAIDQQSGVIYYATDRPGAIYQMAGVNGSPTLVAGQPGGSTADGVPAGQAAVFPARNGLAVDAGGNVFFSEPSLHRIRRIDAATGLVSTIGGTGYVNRPDPTYIYGDSRHRHRSPRARGARVQSRNRRPDGRR